MNKKTRFKAGLLVGIGFSIFFFLENMLLNENNTSKEIIKSVVAALLAGGISGVLFGWLMGFFIKPKPADETKNLDEK